MRTKINEGLPAMVPEIPVNIAGQSMKLRFDTNINKTKKGVKLQFVLPGIPEDPRQLQQLANKIGSELQTEFGNAGLQIIYDVENPYKNVIGFLLPLTSISDFILKNVLKKDQTQDEQQPDEETPEVEQEPKEKLPAKPVAEGRIRLADLLK